MNRLVLLLVILCPAFCFSQAKVKTDTVTFSRSKAENSKFISDIVPVPKGCKVTSYDLSAKMNGKVMVMKNIGGDDLPRSVASVLKNSDEGSKTFIDLKMTCPEERRQHYYVKLKN